MYTVGNYPPLLSFDAACPMSLRGVNDVASVHNRPCFIIQLISNDELVMYVLRNDSHSLTYLVYLL